jgi:hypothetical protein
VAFDTTALLLPLVDFGERAVDDKELPVARRGVSDAGFV